MRWNSGECEKAASTRVHVHLAPLDLACVSGSVFRTVPAKPQQMSVLIEVYRAAGGLDGVCDRAHVCSRG